MSQTTPYISCFDSVVAGALWWTKWGGKLLGSGGGEEFGEAYIRAQITSKICGDTNKELLNFVGTTSVARDMLAISDKSWKGKKKAIVVEKDGKKRKQGLRYWGFSYGSVLGVTFATMFPDRVERLIVDGMACLLSPS